MIEPGDAPASEIVFYQGEDGRSRIQVRLDGGTVWLTQRLLAELFQKDVRTINEHLQNIFEEGELDPGATIRKFRIVQLTAETKEFFQTVQNKLHWAITGSTAAEIIAERANAERPNMGLTTWKGAKVRRADVTIAKNYLNEGEIRQLNRIVTMYLDYAEEQAERRRPLYMRDWRAKLDAFLAFNERDILKDAGRISAEIAQKLALDEYEKFERRRLVEEASAADPLEEAARRLGPRKPAKRPPR